MATRQDYVDYAVERAEARGISPDIFIRMIDQESGFNPQARSGAGAEGIAQMMPATSRGRGVDPWDPWASLEAAAQILRENLDRFGEDYSLALAAYNAGAGAVEKYGGIPPYEETQRYVTAILGSGSMPDFTGEDTERGRFPAAAILGLAVLLAVIN